MITENARAPAPQQAPNPPANDRADGRRALVLFLILWAIYVFTASARFHSDDEMSVFAVAASLVGRGDVTIDQIAWNQDLGGGVGRTLEDGRVYSKYGLGGALAIAPLVALAQTLPWAGAVGMATLLNGPLTAATAALLYLTGRRLGISATASALAALTFGLATLAWVYARYLFGEPIVAFSWMLAFWLLLGQSAAGAVGAGLASGWAILVRTASAMSAPLFLPLVLAGRKRHDLLLFLLPNALALAAVGLYNATRFGSPLDSGYNPVESFTAPLGEGLWGLLLSPGRGIVWYAPPVLLALVGAPLLLRRQPAAAATALLLVVTNLLLYAKWHAWHGGWGWGPRLLVPIVPFLLVLALPVFARAVAGGGRLGWAARLAVGALFFLGVAVSALGVLVDFNQPLLALLAAHPELGAGVLFLTLADWGASPIAAHLALLPSVAPDLVWLSGGIAWPLAIVGALTVLLTLRLVAAGWSGAPAWPVLALFSAIAIAALAGAGTHVAYAVGRLSPAGREIAAAVERIRAEARPGDRLVVVGVGEAEALLNRLPPWLPAVQILPEAEPLSPHAEARLARAASGKRIWLLQRTPQPPGEDNGIEARLDQLAYKRDTQTTGTVDLTRYIVAPPTVLTPAAIDFGDRLRLTGWAARVADATLLLDLDWLALRAPNARYVVSVRLTDGETRLQHDREPTDGARPTDQWRRGDTVRERLGLPLPADFTPGMYRLQLVVYPAGGGRPLPVGSGDVATAGEVRLP
ncbi:MAG: hypothetical protein RMM58_00975 [Chloroflexota bacterium]|nr:hypothetical protein [Dehalococcoidia bacterium]MDW8252431.1 hypothetical protein [Chloroflexota bacterium]